MFTSEVVFRKARREHMCGLCGKPIPKGETHATWTWLTNSRRAWVRERQHLHCHKAMKAWCNVCYMGDIDCCLPTCWSTALYYTACAGCIGRHHCPLAQNEMAPKCDRALAIIKKKYGEGK
jgi:hypothetical protein